MCVSHVRVRVHVCKCVRACERARVLREFADLFSGVCMYLDVLVCLSVLPSVCVCGVGDEGTGREP